jgi:hypothetical protein
MISDLWLGLKNAEWFSLSLSTHFGFELVHIALGLVQLLFETSSLLTAYRLSAWRLNAGRRRTAPLHLVALDAEVVFELIALVARECVVVFADALDSRGQLAAEARSRIRAGRCRHHGRSGSCVPQLLNLFGVHLAQKEQLFLKTLLVVLERQPLLHLQN